ncbi:MAG: hypothetical protein K0R88_1947 [Solirubrobacterales bacterium]|nr:hypothetical protein [Solirubrobacterales bacterium]
MSLRESEAAFLAGGAHPAGDAGATYSRVADLPLRIDRCELVPLVRDTSSGFTKVSIVVRLTGDGHEGQGEDITWDQIDQIEQLRHAGDLSWLRGRRTLDEFSTLLGLADLFPVEPVRESARDYRRWAFESAALDLALRQSGVSLQDAVGRAAQPVNFVMSTRIADSSGLAALRALRGMDAALRFKLDLTPSWDRALLAELASLAAVEVVDMKGTYRNATVAMEPDPDLYRRVFEALPGAWIEDPAVADDTVELLDRHRERITWDVPIRSVGDIETLPWPPRLLNLKPARFGSVRRLFETYDYCGAQGISTYGGACSNRVRDGGSSSTSHRCSIPTVQTISPPWSTTCSSARVTSRARRSRPSHTRPASAGAATTGAVAFASDRRNSPRPE